MTLQEFVTLMAGHEIALGLLISNVTLAGWTLTRIKRVNNDLAELKSSVRQIAQTLRHQKNLEETVQSPVLKVSSSIELPAGPGPIHRSPPKLPFDVETFIATLRAGGSLQDAAERHDLTEDEALAVSISYRDAASSAANSSAIS